MAKFVVYPVPMPDVDDPGTTEATAVAAIEAIATSYNLLYEHSSTIPAGEIISQDPAPGVEVLEDTTVTLTVSLGEDPATETPGGLNRRRQRRRRYFAQVNGQTVELNRPSDAYQLFNQLKRSEPPPRKAPLIKGVPVHRSATPAPAPVVQAPPVAAPRVPSVAPLEGQLAQWMAQRLAQRAEEDTLLFLM